MVSTQQSPFADFLSARHLIAMLPVLIIWIVRTGYRSTRQQVGDDNFRDLIFNDADHRSDASAKTHESATKPR
jgi:hypothetical protein